MILKESRGQQPQTPNHFFKTMTTFNNDYSNAELLDQELTTAELSQVSAGLVLTNGPLEKAVINGLQGIGEFIYEGVKEYVNQQRPIGL